LEHIAEEPFLQGDDLRYMMNKSREEEDVAVEAELSRLRAKKPQKAVQTSPVGTKHRLVEMGQSSINKDFPSHV
jgi:hypothetical protein